MIYAGHEQSRENRTCDLYRERNPGSRRSFGSRVGLDYTPMKRDELRFYILLFGSILLFFLALKLLVWPNE